jgi:TolB-like protein/Tfp pilus assembly protein PilF
LKNKFPNKNSKTTITLAILPFDNFTGDIQTDYFSRGFVEDLITDLSRFPNLNIISSHTSLSERIQPDASTAEQYSINYFLKGSLRKIVNKIRISTQLFNPFNQNILWAEKYDSPLEKIFEIHDSIIEQVVSSLSVNIDIQHLSLTRKKVVTQLEAYDCWLRGYEYLRMGTVKDDENARNIFKLALEIDPHYGRAYAGISLSYFNEWTCQLWELWDENINKAFDYANIANSYSANDHLVQMILGRVLLYRRNFDFAEKHINKSYELNPNDADCLVQLANCQGLLGNTKEAILLFNRALSLNPLYFDWYNVYGTMVYFAAEDYDNLLKLAEEIPVGRSVDLAAYIAVAYAYKSNKEKAEYYIQLYKKYFKDKIKYGQDPFPGEALDWVIAVNPYKKEEDIKRLIHGLNLAGLESNESGKSFYDTADNSIKIKTLNTFKKNGNLWHISFNNLFVQFPEVKGFIDISKLLANADKEIHCTDLMGNISSFDGGIEAIDEKAKRKYQSKIQELQSDLREAEEMNDIGRVEIISTELNQIIDHLSKSTGIKGRSRKIADPSEKARAAVTLRIKSAVQKIETVHPSLAKHFQNNIRTGTYCIYSPENPVKWEL